MNTYYEILGLAPGASQMEIKKAYFKLVRQHSPESDPEQFQKIREAYEQLKTAGDTPQGPEFAPLSDQLAVKMLEQIMSSRKSGNNKLYRDTSEEAWRRFPKEIQFLYHLIIAQRKCGNTGKAVKNAELLVGKDPENKWFQRELAISYIERGFTQKAYWACEKAYEMGCRDLDFVLMYSIECNEYAEYDQGMKILLEVIRQDRKWTKEEMPELLETYSGLIAMNLAGRKNYFPEILDSLCQNLKQYSIFFADYALDFSRMLAGISCVQRYTDKEYQKMEEAFDLLQKLCHTEKDIDFVSSMREEFVYQRILRDTRINDTMKMGLEIYYDIGDYDTSLKKFAETDMWLCMIEERAETLKQAKIIQQDYPDFYKYIEEFIQKLKVEKNLFLIKDNLLKTYRRMEPMYGGGVYYEKYPLEKRRALGTLINGGFTEEPYYRTEKKIGRNAPCPCGSGKKYKNCCLKK